MVIKNFIMKEKHFVMNNFPPSPQMAVKVNRMNIMPPEVLNNEFQCVIKVSFNLEDEQQRLLVTIDVAYIINVIMNEKDGVYEQDAFANRIFNVLQGVYVKTANDMLRETPFPPLPANFEC